MTTASGWPWRPARASSRRSSSSQARRLGRPVSASVRAIASTRASSSSRSASSRLRCGDVLRHRVDLPAVGVGAPQQPAPAAVLRRVAVLEVDHARRVGEQDARCRERRLDVVGMGELDVGLRHQLLAAPPERRLPGLVQAREAPVEARGGEQHVGHREPALGLVARRPRPRGDPAQRAADREQDHRARDVAEQAQLDVAHDREHEVRPEAQRGDAEAPAPSQLDGHQADREHVEEADAVGRRVDDREQGGDDDEQHEADGERQRVAGPVRVPRVHPRLHDGRPLSCPTTHPRLRAMPTRIPAVIPPSATLAANERVRAKLDAG